MKDVHNKRKHEKCEYIGSFYFGSFLFLFFFSLLLFFNKAYSNILDNNRYFQHSMSQCVMMYNK